MEMAWRRTACIWVVDRERQERHRRHHRLLLERQPVVAEGGGKNKRQQRRRLNMNDEAVETMKLPTRPIVTITRSTQRPLPPTGSKHTPK